MQEHRAVGQKAGLSGEAVLAAARSIADREGVEALTMRRLADALAVMPNSLYSYYPTKDALLDAVLDSLLGEIETASLDVMGWREALVRIMDDSRRLLLSHPKLVDVFLTRPSFGPNAAHLGEVTFRTLRRAGLEGEVAVGAFRILLIFSLGYAAFQAPRLGDDERSKRGESAFRSLPRDSFPEVTTIATPLARPPDDETFIAGLGWLIDGIARTSSSGQSEKDE